MNAILVDTSAYSALKRDDARIITAIAEAGKVCMNPVILGELLFGFRKGNQYTRNKEFLDTFMDNEEVDILDMDVDTAHRYAVIRNALQATGTPVMANDLWIAASAMQHGLRLITLDRDYLKIPQIVVDFFDPL